MSQDSNNSRFLVLKYLVIFTAGGLVAASYLVAMVSVLAATLVFVSSVEAGSIFAWLAIREEYGSVANRSATARSVEMGLRKFQHDSESKP